MPVTKEDKEALQGFFRAVRELRAHGIIDSDRYLGDIGEFLAATEYHLTLAKSKRQQGHDTEGHEERVQIKFHNSTTRTNIDFGDPHAYDYVIAVIGPDSLLHPGAAYAGHVVFYRFSSEHVRTNFPTHSCGKNGLGKPDRALSLTTQSDE